MRSGWFPIPENYRKTGVSADVIAGLTLGILLIPQAMAYGMLAGVPPVYGLYAALLPMLVYALVASTPHVSVGPTALASLLCLNGISGLAEPGSSAYLGYAVLLAGLTGALQLLFGILRLGGIGNLLSRPVLSGFVSAAAVLISVSQLDVLLGITTSRTTYFHDSLLALGAGFSTIHWPSAIMGVGSLGGLFLAKALLPSKFPTMLTLIISATLLVWGFGGAWGITTVEEIPAGLPMFQLPSFELTHLAQLLPVALVLALISFIETLSIGKAFSPRHPYYRVQANRELVALGLSKLAGMFLQAIPTSASFSRSAVIESGGGKGPLSNITAVVLLIVVLLFLTPVFYYLPVPVLAAIIIFSVRKLFDVTEMRRLLKLAPKEFITLIITFLFTLFAGLQYGIAGGVLLSLFFVFARAARPHLAELGRVPGTNAFRNRNRFAEAEVDPSVLIIRFDAELYFGNAAYFREQLEKLVDQRGEALRAVILDSHTINDIDTSGIFALSRFLDGLEKRDVEFFLTGTIGPVRDMLYKSGLMQRMGAGHHFLSIQQALEHLASDRCERGWDLPAVQHD
ncbi:MAG: sulfate permease [Bacteroidota bacterium]